MAERKFKQKFTPICISLCLLVLLAGKSFGANIPVKRPSHDKYCFDYTETLPSKLVHRINMEGGGLNRNLDMDLVVVITPTIADRSIEDVAVKLFTGWEIGKSTAGKKGLLILIAKKEQKIKMEVGYDLEGVFTDAYIGLVERDMLKEFLEQSDWDRGFMSTIENMVERIFGKGYYEEVRHKSSPKKEIGYYSQGAGAKTTFDLGAALQRPQPQTTKEFKEFYGAQPTVERAFECYITKNNTDYEIDLFTDESRQFFRNWRTSSGQRRAEREAANGKQYIIKQRGKYAVLMAPFNTPINDFVRQNNCPYYFRRGEKGWQVDINAMSRSIIMGPVSWHFLTKTHPYMFAFEDYYLMGNRAFPKQGQKAYIGLNYSWMKKAAEGFYVFTEGDSPAEKAGIQEDDILLLIDGMKITTMYQDWDMMMQYLPGDVVTLEILRNGRRKSVRVKLEKPKSIMEDDDFYRREEREPWCGFYFGYSQPYERDIEDVQLSVVDVVAGSPAERAEFKPVDLIYKIEGVAEKHIGVGQYEQKLKTVRPGDTLKFHVLRDLKERLVLEVVVGEYRVGMGGY